MVGSLAVGGGVPPMGGAGFDAWPLAGLAVALWIGRRLVRLPWRATLLIGGLAGALVFPPLVEARGIVEACALALAVGILTRALVATAARKRDPSV